MKNIYCKWLATALLALASIGAKAYHFKVDGIYYNTLSTSNTCSVTYGDTKYTGEVTIPRTVTYDGQTLTVTSIGESAFPILKRFLKAAWVKPSNIRIRFLPDFPDT